MIRRPGLKSQVSAWARRACLVCCLPARRNEDPIVRDLKFTDAGGAGKEGGAGLGAIPPAARCINLSAELVVAREQFLLLFRDLRKVIFSLKTFIASSCLYWLIRFLALTCTLRGYYI